MEKIVYYKIEEEIANSIRKILEKISDNDMKKVYNLTNEEILHIHNYLDSVDVDRGEY